MDIEYGIPLFFRHFANGFVLKKAGIMDNAINSTQLIDNPLNQTCTIFNLARKMNHLAASINNGLRCTTIILSRTVQRDGRARLRRTPGKSVT